MTTFVTVVRTEGDATQAAELLRINQPSMSKRLAFLQHAGRILRRPWLERMGKTWRLTDEGRRVLPAVEELVHRYRLLTDAIDEARPAVVFGCGFGGAAGFVRDAVRAFRGKYPEATFRISSRPAGARVEGVANGSLDLAVVRLEEQEILEIGRRPLFVEDLYEDPLVLAAVSGSPGFDEFQGLAEKTVPPKMLTRFPLVLPAPDSGIRRDLDRRFRDAGILDRLNIAVEVSPWQTSLAYVRDAVGVGVVPRSAVAHQSGLVIKGLPPKLSPANSVRAICRKRAGSEDLDLTEKGQEFFQALRDAAAKAAA